MCSENSPVVSAFPAGCFLVVELEKERKKKEEKKKARRWQLSRQRRKQIRKKETKERNKRNKSKSEKECTAVHQQPCKPIRPSMVECVRHTLVWLGILEPCGPITLFPRLSSFCPFLSLSLLFFCQLFRRRVLPCSGTVLEHL
jgi:hypothetical protein